MNRFCWYLPWTWRKPRVKRYYKVGDVAPDSLLNRKPGTNIGAFVAIDPETKIITAMFIP